MSEGRGEEKHRKPEGKRNQPASGFLKDLWSAVPIVVAITTAAKVAKASLNIYDEGVYLTMARFADFHHIAYRDFFTLYGPGTTVLGPIVNAVFGRQLLAHRAADFAIVLLLTAGIYRLASAYVGRWLAAIMASSVATIALPAHHFARTLALLAWGAVLIQRSLDGPGRRRRALWPGFTLVGLSFLGRYEFSILAILLVAVLAIYLYGLVDAHKLKRAVIAGLAPPVAFWLWLLAAVPMATLVENFYRYPMIFYPRPECRGIPTPWKDSFHALLAPLDRFYWNGRDLVLILGNVLPPFLAAILLLRVVRSWRSRRPQDVTVLFVAALLIMLFVEMRPRSGSTPEPVVIFALIGLAMTVDWVRSYRPRVANGAQVAVGVILATAVAISVNTSLDSWKGWPRYNSVLGFTSGTSDYGFYRPEVIGPIEQAVHRFAPPNTPIFVALRDNRGTFANAASLYWLLDRPPASRFMEFDPCLTDRSDVQRIIIDDIRETDVVVQSSFFPHRPFEATPSVLDEYLAQEFAQVAETRVRSSPAVETYTVLVRRSRLSQAAAQ